MQVLIIDCADPRDREFNNKLFKYVNSKYSNQIINYKNLPAPSKIEASFEKIIITGVPTFYSLETIYNRAYSLRWVKNTTLPTAGICLGHQAIGHIFGSKIIESGEAESGLKEIVYVTNDSVFDGLPSPFNGETLHNASITLPDEFNLIAKSENCSNEAMKHKTKPLYGFQFHPEFHKQTNLILENFLSL